MTGKCVNNGAKPKWTDKQMLDALKRVQAVVWSCTVDEYRARQLPNEPCSQAIASRFRTWNRAKVAAGLPITVKVRKKSPTPKDEIDMRPTKRTTYPCWKCEQPFRGLGRRKGNWHCETCTLTINAQAAGGDG